MAKKKSEGEAGPGHGPAGAQLRPAAPAASAFLDVPAGALYRHHKLVEDHTNLFVRYCQWVLGRPAVVVNRGAAEPGDHVSVRGLPDGPGYALSPEGLRRLYELAAAAAQPCDGLQQLAPAAGDLRADRHADPRRGRALRPPALQRPAAARAEKLHFIWV